MAHEKNTLFVQCDNLITHDGAQRKDTLAFLNAGTGSWSIHASEANAVAGTPELASGALTYVPSSNGKYRGIFESSQFTLVKGTKYWLRTQVSESGADDTRIVPSVARYHQYADS